MITEYLEIITHYEKSKRTSKTRKALQEREKAREKTEHDIAKLQSGTGIAPTHYVSGSIDRKR